MPKPTPASVLRLVNSLRINSAAFLRPVRHSLPSRKAWISEGGSLGGGMGGDNKDSKGEALVWGLARVRTLSALARFRRGGD